MNEFIVWDEDLDRFQNEDGLLLDKNLKVYNSVGEILDENIYKPFFYIGLTDIDGKKIYADCSIVEFLESDGSVYAKGYFVYDNKLLAYKVFDLDDNVFYKYSDFICFKTKVIDTIQENKIGLIK